MSGILQSAALSRDPIISAPGRLLIWASNSSGSISDNITSIYAVIIESVSAIASPPRVPALGRSEKVNCKLFSYAYSLNAS